MELDKEVFFLIGQKLISLRLKNNQTQNDIEYLTGIDKGEISKYESGKRNFTIKTLCKFAIALRVHPKELLNIDFDFESYYKELDNI